MGYLEYLAPEQSHESIKALWVEVLLERAAMPLQEAGHRVQPTTDVTIMQPQVQQQGQGWLKELVHLNEERSTLLVRLRKLFSFPSSALSHPDAEQVKLRLLSLAQVVHQLL